MRFSIVSKAVVLYITVVSLSCTKKESINQSKESVTTAVEHSSETIQIPEYDFEAMTALELRSAIHELFNLRMKAVRANDAIAEERAKNLERQAKVRLVEVESAPEQ